MSTLTQRPSSAARSIRNAATSVRTVVADRIRAESVDFLLLAGTTIFLVIVGVVMVFSSSTVTSYRDSGDFFGAFVKQGGFALIGVPLMLILSRRSESFYMRFAWLALGVSSLLQLLVVATPLGITVAGNTNWLTIFGFQLQPSELIKLSLVAWLGMMVTRKQDELTSFTRGILPILIGAGIPITLVLIGGDLGTVVIMAAFVFGALFLIGVRLRLFILPLIMATLLFLLFAASSSNRMTRIMSFFGGGESVDYLSDGWQLKQGTFALANGGLFGVGIGQSTAKWSWLPAADNDFIFAIIGEELGLIGALVVLGMFGLLAFALVRVFVHATTPFGRTATAAVTVWMLLQATANIAVVLGVIPVLGVPLPLVSAGGTALLANLAALGIVLSVARSSAERPAVEHRS